MGHLRYYTYFTGPRALKKRGLTAEEAREKLREIAISKIGGAYVLPGATTEIAAANYKQGILFIITTLKDSAQEALKENEGLNRIISEFGARKYKMR